MTPREALLSVHYYPDSAFAEELASRIVSKLAEAGFAIVPVEPTEEMIIEGFTLVARRDATWESAVDCARAAWEAMIAAAPK